MVADTIPNMNKTTEDCSPIEGMEFHGGRDNKFLEYDQIKTGMNSEEEDWPEIEVIENPVVKRIVFQFKKPVRPVFS